MATKTFYLQNVCGDNDLYAGVLAELIAGITPAAAVNWGTTVIGKLAANSFGRMRFGLANAVTTANTSTTSFIDSATAPLKGTAISVPNTSDSLRCGPYRGSFASGNWTFTFVVRTTVSTATGRFRFRVWKSANADGTSGTALTSATQLSGTATMSAINTNQTVTCTWAAPAITLAGEYLFVQIEWQELTSAGGSTSAAICLQTNSTRVVTTDWTQGTDNLFTTVNEPFAALGSWFGTAFISAVQSFNNTVMSLVGGRMRVTSSTTNQFPAAQFKLSGLIPGNTYPFKGDYFYTATGNVFMTIRSDVLGVNGSVYDSGDLTANGSLNVNVVPETATAYLVILCDSSAANFAEYDNVVFGNLVTDVPITITALTTGSISPPTFVATQDHIVAETALTIGSPTLPTFAATQVHAVVETALTISSPVLPTFVSVQNFAAVLTGKDISSPVLPTFVATQVHVVVGTALTISSPTLPTFVATQVHTAVLTAKDISSPGLPTFVATQVHSVAVTAKTISSPGLPTLVATQVHALVFTSISSGAPTLPTLVATQVQGVTFTNLSIGSPTLPTALATQVHALTLTGKDISSPSLPTLAATQVHTIVETSLTISSPVLPTVVVAVVGDAVVTALTISSPALPTATVVQNVQAVITAKTISSPDLPTVVVDQVTPQVTLTDLTIGGPVLPTATATQNHAVLLSTLTIGSPDLPNFANTQVQSIAATSMSIASPVFPTFVVTSIHVAWIADITINGPTLPSVVISQVHVVAEQSLSLGSPILPTFMAGQGHVIGIQALTIGSPIMPTMTVLNLLILEPVTSTPGNWTTNIGGTDLQTAVDEVDVDDTDYIHSKITPVNDTADLDFGGTVYELSSPLTVRYRIGKEFNNPMRLDLTVTLFDGATQLAQWVHTDVPYGLQTIEQSVVISQTPNDLLLEMVANAP